MIIVASILVTLCVHATAQPLSNRQVSCSGDPSIPYDPSCYGQLGINAWLQSWNKTVPRCTSASSGARCCGPSGNPNEPWSTCFLRLALGNADYDCSQINVKSCSLEGFQLAQGTNATAQMRYIVRNLYCKSTSRF